MEKTSQSTSYHNLCLTESIALLFYSTISFWITSLHKFSTTFLPQLNTCRSKARAETSQYSSTTKGSEVELYKEDVEMVMQKMGISNGLERDKLAERIAFDELSAMFEEKEPSLEEVKEAFTVFDKNSDGFVDASELQRVLSELGFMDGVELEECRRMVAAYDENNDGRIDFNEFVKFMESSFCC